MKRWTIWFLIDSEWQETETVEALCRKVVTRPLHDTKQLGTWKVRQVQ